MVDLLSNYFTYRDDGLYVEDVKLSDIADGVGTPVYIYSKAEIVKQIRALQDAFKVKLADNRQPRFFYACKANSNIHLLNLVREMGICLETVSVGEVYRGVKAGFDGGDILVTGVGKSDFEIREMLQAGVYSLNVESVPELHRINKIAGDMQVTAPVMIRFNPNVEAGGNDKIKTGRAQDKFGLSRETIATIYQADDFAHINFLGLSMHIGSQIDTVDAYRLGYQAMADLVVDLRGQGATITSLDIGGGFGIRYLDEVPLDLNLIAQAVADIIEPLSTEIIMEPGRYIAGNAGLLLTKVEYVKEEGGRKFLVLDSAMNDLIRPTLYDAYHAMAPCQNPDSPITTYDIVGPICETGDTFARDRHLPEMAESDLCVIQSAGAYTACMASNYNTRPMLPEILIDGDNYKIIRRRQTYDDMFELEE